MAVAGDGIGVSPRVAAMTTSHWLPRVSDWAYENYPLLKLLKQKGRSKRIQGGGELRWIGYASYPSLQTFADGAPHSFAPTGGFKNAILPFAFYRLTEALSPREKAENKGAAAKGQLVPTVTRRLQDAAVQQLGPELFIDGNASGNSLKLQGLESMFGITGGSQTPADELATVLADTYAGLSTAYGSVGGVSSATQATHTVGAWAWSPPVVNCNRTPSGGSLLTWDDNCDAYIRLGARSATWGSARMEWPDLGVFREPSHRALLERLENTHRTMLASSELQTRYGFNPPGAVNFEGVLCYWDRAVPSSDSSSDVVHGYLLNTDKMALHIMDSGVTGAVKAEGEANLFDFWQGFDIYTFQDVYALLMFGQLQFECPRYFAKFAEIS